ncbi:MAG: hypothetical protein AAFR65_03265 [Pseudomonadota bacterium]
MSAAVIALPSKRWQQMRRDCLAAHRDKDFAFTGDEVAFMQRLGLDGPPGADERAHMIRLWSLVTSALGGDDA